jgi:integrase
MEWRGTVIAVRGRLRLLVKDEEGNWVQRALGLADTPENRVTAQRKLADVRRQMQALLEATGGEGGPLTVERWGERWLLSRDNRDAENDAARLRLHVFPSIGHLRLEEVQPRHLAALAKEWQTKAPRTRRNIYSVVRAMFRDAKIEGVLDGPDPCILTHRQIGKIKDSPGFNRREARYTRDELAMLVSDERVPPDRRVWYALMGLAFLRTGEAAGLRWKKLEQAEPLGRLVANASYDLGTKTSYDGPAAGDERWVPVHPTLAAILAEWKLAGWARMFKRPPGGDDLVVPVAPEGPRKGRMKTAGSMRDKDYARKRLLVDLTKLQLRQRRGYDLRRTGISLAQDDGASRDVLRWATHAPPSEVFDFYTTLEWETVCREVAKMRVQRATSLLPRTSNGQPSGPDEQP